LARRKTGGERRAARRGAFQAYFAECRTQSVRLAGETEIILPQGLLVGLGDAEGRELGMGLVESSEPGAVLVRVPASGKRACWLRPGALILDDGWSDHKLAMPVPERIALAG
jgi:hypothetical protein